MDMDRFVDGANTRSDLYSEYRCRSKQRDSKTHIQPEVIYKQSKTETHDFGTDRICVKSLVLNAM